MSLSARPLILACRPSSLVLDGRLPQLMEWGALLLLVVWSSYLPDVYGRGGALLGLELLLLFGVLFLRLGAQHQGIVFDRSLAWMLAYAAAIVLSLVDAQEPGLTRTELLSYLRDLVAVFVLLNLVTTPAGLRLAIWTVIVTTVALALISLAGAAIGNTLGGLAAVNVGQLAGEERGIRLAGVIGNANDFADILTLVIPLALLRVWDERRVFLRLAALASVLVLLIANVLTLSRGGGVALLVVLGITIIRRWRRSAQLLMSLSIVALLGGVVLVVPGVYWDRFRAVADFATGDSSDLSRLDGSLHERAQLWQVGVSMARQHPVVGVGKGNYLINYPTYATEIAPNLLNRPLQAHSTPIQIAAETGLIGLAALAALIIATVVGLREARRRFAAAGITHGVVLAESIHIALWGHLTVSLFISDDRPRFLWLVVVLAMIARQVSRNSSRVATAGGL